MQRKNVKLTARHIQGTFSVRKGIDTEAYS